MKTLNETFNDEEHKELLEFKGHLTWREFILAMFKHCKETIKQEDLKW